MLQIDISSNLVDILILYKLFCMSLTFFSCKILWYLKLFEIQSPNRINSPTTPVYPINTNTKKKLSLERCTYRCISKGSVFCYSKKFNVVRGRARGRRWHSVHLPSICRGVEILGPKNIGSDLNFWISVGGIKTLKVVLDILTFCFFIFLSILF